MLIFLKTNNFSLFVDIYNMLKSYKYKINSNEEQKVLLNKYFDSIRFVCNYFINERKMEYETNKNSINF